MADQPDAPSDPAAEDPRAWIGHRLDEMDGSNVGKVEGVFVDELDEKMEWLLARMGRFGHHTLIPGRDAVEGVGHVWVPYRRDQIRQAPRINPKAALTVAGERKLLEHYGIAAAAGRAAELDEREDSDISARPA